MYKELVLKEGIDIEIVKSCVKVIGEDITIDSVI
jgi:hypothetical protein